MGKIDWNAAYQYLEMNFQDIKDLVEDWNSANPNFHCDVRLTNYPPEIFVEVMNNSQDSRMIKRWSDNEKEKAASICRYISEIISCEIKYANGQDWEDFSIIYRIRPIYNYFAIKERIPR